MWGRVEDITDEEFDRVLRGNFLGQVYGARAVLPALRRCRGGLIGGSAVGSPQPTPLPRAHRRLAVIRRLAGHLRSGQADIGTDNVDSPVDEPGQVHDSRPGGVLRHSLFTQLIGHRPLPGEHTDVVRHLIAHGALWQNPPPGRPLVTAAVPYTSAVLGWRPSPRCRCC
ncbi:hypothetical protein ACLQ28_32750 [Micromonospora sp. DT201]|uniref:hypothetical protein n=1 Tax=Micromonospora sp. DT201 TaxID=3393442 RepID=UPI003CF3E605